MSEEYDKGWVEGCDAQDDCDHEYIIRPLKAENRRLRKIARYVVRCQRIIDWLQEAETSSIMTELEVTMGNACPTGLLEMAVPLARLALNQTNHQRHDQPTDESEQS